MQSHDELGGVESLWTRQLYREYEEILWYYRVKMRPVVIQVADMGSRWGQWDPFFRVITIARKLITDYSWDMVLEILKHEIAHHYVDEVYGSDMGAAHGEAFKAACKIFAVSAWAARATGDLPEAIPTLRERVLSAEDEKLLSRVEKLLALAQSTNENEALLAMQKVREIYAKHEIGRLREHKSSEMDHLIISRGRKKMERHESKVFSILNDHFFVKIVYTTLYSAKDQTKYKAVELLGTRANLLMAEYVYFFLMQQCESLWRRHRKTTGCSGRLRASFMLGVLHGFDDKLSAVPVQEIIASNFNISAKESKALIAVSRDEIKQYMEERYPRLGSRSAGRARVDSGTFSAGTAAGRTITLSKGVASSRGFSGYLSSGR